MKILREIYVSKKTWIIFVAVCVLVFGGLVFYSQRDKIDVSSVDTNSLIAASDANGQIADHIDGNKDAKVTLIEYGDYQCPGCGAAHPKVKSLVEKYGDNIAFVFRNYPLTGIHPNARAAAAAVEAAGLKGKYWEMHNIMYESQNEWSEVSADKRGELFKGYAEQAGVKGADYDAALSEQSAKINSKISFDQALGRKVNVTGTPTFYLNGTLVDSATFDDEAKFEKAITDELRKQGVKVE